MKLALATVAAVSLLFGTTISNAQDRERPHSVAAQTERMRHEHGQRHDDGGRDHRRGPIVIVVGVPIVAGSPYDYLIAPPPDLYRTIDGFYYYCAEPPGYYPTVPDCPNGWRLVP